MTILVQNTWLRGGPVRRGQLRLSHLHAQDGRELGEVRGGGGAVPADTFLTAQKNKDVGSDRDQQTTCVQKSDEKLQSETTTDVTRTVPHCNTEQYNHLYTQELSELVCESRGGRPGLPSLINLRFLWT